MQLKALFWDIDNTLLDFRASSHEAFFEVCQEYGLEVEESHFSRWFTFKESLWRKQEQGLVTIDYIVRNQFAELFEEAGCKADCQAFGLRFQHLLHYQAVPVEGALEALHFGSQHWQQYAASNGYLDQQTSRLQKAEMFHLFNNLFVSDVIGAAKPTKEFFNKSLNICQLQPSNILMIGDNIVTDIQGAQDMGFNTCWFNPTHETSTIKPTFEVHSHEELKHLLSTLC